MSREVIERVLSNLNRNQKAAVDCNDNLLVLAGAGSGKTTVVTIKVGNDVVNNNVQPEKILCITFTNKASKEMKERISALIPEFGKKVNVSTYHSWCVAFLRVHAELISRTRGFIIVDDDDAMKLIKFFCSDEDAEQMVGFHFLDPEEVACKIKSLKESITDFDVSHESLAHFSEAERYVFNMYEKKLRYMNALDFTDLIRYATAIMKSDYSLIPQYDRVFVDEFQDTNEAQFKMTEMIGMRAKTITSVGDDDQSIYEWRGAKPSNMQLFIQHFSAKRIDLEENYRSTDVIVGAANKLISYNKDRLGKTMVPVKNSDKKISVVKTMSQDSESDFVAAMVNDYLLKYKDNSVGILYRNNRYSRKIETALRRKGVSYKLTKGLEFTKRREIALVFRFLRLANNPRDIVSLDYVLSHFVSGIGPKSIVKINNAIENLEDKEIFSGKGIPLKGDQLSKYIWIINLAKRIGELPLNEVGFALGTYFIPSDDFVLTPEFEIDIFNQGTNHTINNIDFKVKNDVCIKRLKDKFCTFRGDKKEQLEDRIDNFDELIVWLEEFSARRKNATLSDFLQDASIDASDKDTKDAARVNLMTVHSAKGLEFNRVYIIGCLNGFFPGLREGEEGNLEEARRLMYVAITRAKEELVMMVPETVTTKFNDNQIKPSMFIKEISPFVKLTDMSKKSKMMNKVFERI